MRTRAAAYERVVAGDLHTNNSRRSSEVAHAVVEAARTGIFPGAQAFELGEPGWLLGEFPDLLELVLYPPPVVEWKVDEVEDRTAFSARGVVFRDAGLQSN